MDWRRYTASLRAAAGRLARLSPARAARVAAAMLVLAAGISAALVLPSGPAAGQVAELAAPQFQAAPVTYALPGSPARDKADHAQSVSLALATADAVASHQAHLRHVAHAGHVALLARQAASARAAQSAAFLTAAPASSSRPPRGSTGQAPAPSGGSSGSPQSSGCSDPAGQLTQSQIGMLWLCAGGPASAESAAEAVSHCESGWNTHAYNPSGASGLWQILGQVVSGWIFDAHVNALNAVAKYRAGGWAPWVCKP